MTFSWTHNKKKRTYRIWHKELILKKKNEWWGGETTEQMDTRIVELGGTVKRHGLEVQRAGRPCSSMSWSGTAYREIYDKDQRKRGVNVHVIDVKIIWNSSSSCHNAVVLRGVCFDCFSCKSSFSNAITCSTRMKLASRM